jgi:hypothetical protein
MSSTWCSNGAFGRNSPVSGSKGGMPETNTMLPARVQVDTGAPHFSKLLSMGSTRMISRSMRSLLVRWASVQAPNPQPPTRRRGPGIEFIPQRHCRGGQGWKAGVMGAVGFRLGLRLAMLPSVGVLVVGASSAIKSS